MTPEELIAKSQTYSDSSQQIHEMLEKLTALQGDIADQWKGKAFEGFNEQFNQLTPQVRNFADLLQDIQIQLQKTAEAVEQQDQALSQNFGLR